MPALTVARRCALGLWLACACAAAQAPGRVPMPLGDDPFTDDSVRRGVSATQLACAQLPEAVWAQAPAGEAECIRYWSAGFGQEGPHAVAMVYIPPDQMAFDQVDAGYARRGPREMQALARGMQAAAGVPFILLSRPGIFGSSGDHRQRRREPEARLLSSALDGIRHRHGIGSFVLVGLSGGGHAVASLLGWRSDVVCAVAASAVSAPRMRWQRLGRTSDLTGHDDSYEPLEHLRAGAFHPALRVFVLGDPRDSNVPWETQLPLAGRLRSLGVPVEVLQGEGSDGQRHALGQSARAVGALCARGRPTGEILELAARGLKG